jgi:hypothetical protein
VDQAIACAEISVAVVAAEEVAGDGSAPEKKRAPGLRFTGRSLSCPDLSRD